MFAIWFAFSVVIFAHNILKKQYKELFLHILYFILGCISILAPFLLYLYFAGAFHDFVDQYIVFNRTYASENLTLKIFAYNLKKHIKLCLVWIIPLVTLFWIIRKSNSQQRSFYIAYLLTAVTTLFFSVFSIYYFPRYYIPLIPLLILPYALFINIILPKIVKTQSRNLRYVVPIIIILCCFNRKIFTFANDFRVQAFPSKNISKVPYLSLPVFTITEAIKQHAPSPDDKITVWGNGCLFYYYANRDSVSKFIFQYPISLINPKVAEKYESDILQNPPKLIITPVYDNWLEEMCTTLRTDIKGDISERFLFRNLLPLVREEITINEQTVKVPDPANIRKKYSLVYEDKGYVKIYKRND